MNCLCCVDRQFIYGSPLPRNCYVSRCCVDCQRLQLISSRPRRCYISRCGVGHVMTGRIDHGPAGAVHHLAPERIDLRNGIDLEDGPTQPAKVEVLDRQAAGGTWQRIEITEGRNRQVRRMTAAVGLPTLRLLRVAIDLMDGEAPLSLEGLEPGQWRAVSPDEERRLQGLLRRSPGRGGRAGGGKSGQGGGGG